jgi:hypothetical protein
MLLEPFEDALVGFSCVNPASRRPRSSPSGPITTVIWQAMVSTDLSRAGRDHVTFSAPVPKSR